MYILGISGPLGRDAAACLMRDGQIVAMAEEERFTRVPHATGGMFPVKSIQFCLQQEKITLDAIDYLVLSWDPTLFLPNRPQLREEYGSDIRKLFDPAIFPHSRFPKVEIVDHHLAHAASAYYFSPFEESAVLVVDSAGENSGTSLYWGKDRALRKLDQIHFNESLGEFYAAATVNLGFQSSEMGNTMGLVSFGQPVYDFPKIALDSERGYSIGINHQVELGAVESIWFKEFMKLRVSPPQKVRTYNPCLFRYVDETVFEQQHKNLAASVQKKLEQCYFSLADALVKKTGSRNLCIAGGVAMNSVANGKLAHSGIVDQLFVQPAAYDAGTAIGAAAEISARLGYHIEPLQHVYYGPSFTNDEIQGFLDHAGIKYKVDHDVMEVASRLLADGKTVGWFQGRAEFGARALGNRSILANPAAPDIQNRINSQVKYQEGFRPFSPSVLLEEAGNWFEQGGASPYMMRSIQVQEDKRDKISGVVHVDGSSCPQTVSATTNQRFHSLIEHFYNKTGIPMVINSSFNLRGEPIVGSPYDAVRTFYAGALDAMILNDCVIEKSS